MKVADNFLLKERGQILSLLKLLYGSLTENISYPSSLSPSSSNQQ